MDLCASNNHAVVRISTSNRSNRYNFVSYFSIIIYCVLVGFVFMAGCAPPFSTLQSAKLAGKGKAEITPIFSIVHFLNDGEMTHIQNEYGLQGAYGLNDKIDFRLRYEFINVEYDDPYYGTIDVSAHVIGLGPKIEIYKDMHALHLPIGFAFGEDIDFSETWQFHPTFLFSLSVGKNVEFNPSIKILVPLTGDGDVLVAFNLGAGISGDLKKWAIRPETGFLINPGEDGHFMHFSIGVSVCP